MKEEFRAIVRGRVQLVLYRDFARRKAKSLGIFGTASNLPDGTVEIIAQGDRPALLTYIEELKKGPMLAKVERVGVEWRKPEKEISGFEIIY